MDFETSAFLISISLSVATVGTILSSCIYSLLRNKHEPVVQTNDKEDINTAILQFIQKHKHQDSESVPKNEENKELQKQLINQLDNVFQLMTKTNTETSQRNLSKEAYLDGLVNKFMEVRDDIRKIVNKKDISTEKKKIIDGIFEIIDTSTQKILNDDGSDDDLSRDFEKTN